MDLIEINFKKQIDKVKDEIRNCYDENFDNLIYKYNLFNNIMNTYNDELIEIDGFQEVLENDETILEKIYDKVLGMIVYSLPETFDETILQELLEEIVNEEECEHEN